MAAISAPLLISPTSHPFKTALSHDNATEFWAIVGDQADSEAEPNYYLFQRHVHRARESVVLCPRFFVGTWSADATAQCVASYSHSLPFFSHR